MSRKGGAAPYTRKGNFGASLLYLKPLLLSFAPVYNLIVPVRIKRGYFHLIST